MIFESGIPSRFTVRYLQNTISVTQKRDVHTTRLAGSTEGMRVEHVHAQGIRHVLFNLSKQHSVDDHG